MQLNLFRLYDGQYIISESVGKNVFWIYAYFPPPLQMVENYNALSLHIYFRNNSNNNVISSRILFGGENALRTRANGPSRHTPASGRPIKKNPYFSRTLV